MIGVNLNEVEMPWMRVTMAAEKALETLKEMKKWPSWGTFQAAEPLEIWAREQLDKFSHHAPPIVYDQSWPEQAQHIFFVALAFVEASSSKCLWL